MTDPSHKEIKISCSACSRELDVTGLEPFSSLPCPNCGASMTVPKRLANFLLLALIGKGGTGAVYKAMDLSLHRLVAVKVLKKELAEDAKFVADFSREARAAAALNHPNIVHIYMLGEEDGQSFIVMELVPYGSLDALIEARKKLTEMETLQFGIQIASALHAAHQRGLIHRDVKPGNVLIGEDGMAHLVDFGLAKFQHEAHAHGEETLWGTPDYFAPEKLSGNLVDFRSDMYSLGGTLFHCLVGRPPFDASTAADAVEKNVNYAALSLETFCPDASKETVSIIDKLLRKKPADRYQSYEELLRDLEIAKRIVARKVIATPAAKPSTVEPNKKKTVVLLWAAAVVLAAVSLWTFWYLPKMSEVKKTPLPAATTGTIAVTPPEIPPPPVSPPSADDIKLFDEWNRPFKSLKLFDAVQEYNQAIKVFDKVPTERNWMTLMLGLTHLLRGETDKAMRTFGSITLGDSAFASDKLSYASAPRALADLFSEPQSRAELRKRVVESPKWAEAIFIFVCAIQDTHQGKYREAAAQFKAYAAMARQKERGWLFDFKEMANSLGTEMELMVKTLDEAEQLQKSGQIEAALKVLQDGLSKIATTTPPLRKPLEIQEQKLRPLVEEQKRLENQRFREEEAKRLAEEKKRQEQERARIEVERKMKAELDAATRPAQLSYSFEPLLKTLRELQIKYAAIGGREMLASRVAAVQQLVSFQKRLIADINATPYTNKDIVTRAGLRLIGNISRADEKMVISVLTSGVGEVSADWEDIEHRQVVKLAKFYLETATRQKRPAAELADRHLALAVFCNEYNMHTESETHAREAVRLQPNLKEVVTLIFGKVP